MDKMKWIIFVVVVALIFGAVIFLGKSGTKEFTGDAGKVITEGSIADHTLGSPEQKVVLIEYGDLQCPACGKMHQPIKALVEKYKDKLTFVFRNFPLTTLHPNALAAATVAEAAGKQGKYYEMYDKLYETQESWSLASAEQRSAVFEGYANELGLNVATLKKDTSDQAITDKIARDRSIGRKLGLTSTPSFVLNGKPLPDGDATNIEAIVKAVEDALKAAYPDLQTEQQPAKTEN